MNEQAGRRSYTKPKLMTFGDVRELTQAVGNMPGSADGGTAPGMNKTK